jgi:alpha-tubulin suppressor-like RCC1 family protein
VTRTGEVLVFGNNSVCQLGLGSKAGDDDVYVPTAAKVGRTALAAGAGGQFSAVLVQA